MTPFPCSRQKGHIIGDRLLSRPFASVLLTRRKCLPAPCGGPRGGKKTRILDPEAPSENTAGALGESHEWDEPGKYKNYGPGNNDSEEQA